ncbi:DUF2239 family protein [Novosphingobium sp. 1949]|uniref:DUF2239 family protein n=1 Tax=Novosphingobium organovorum TaxID=2930092 RepID=A0ABT0BCR6_9SPHN|nr:DUF2239 family protein [Novosphingobium organovorum]
MVAALRGREAGVLVFEDASGRPVDLDWRLGLAEIHGVEGRSIEAHAGDAHAGEVAGRAGKDAAPRRRGRPRLGVIAREVTLLPDHWEWLARQPGGASQALRRLVAAARKADAGRTDERAVRERAYRFMAAIAGDFAHFEDASRQLFAGNRAGLEQAISTWPHDVRAYLLNLLDAAVPAP